MPAASIAQVVARIRPFVARIAPLVGTGALPARGGLIK
jgi:hypothetical protein